jgi:hypothetical protein
MMSLYPLLHILIQQTDVDKPQYECYNYEDSPKLKFSVLQNYYRQYGTSATFSGGSDFTWWDRQRNLTFYYSY